MGPLPGVQVHVSNVSMDDRSHQRLPVIHSYSDGRQHYGHAPVHYSHRYGSIISDVTHDKLSEKPVFKVN